jgi:hypothetical protein
MKKGGPPTKVEGVEKEREVQQEKWTDRKRDVHLEEKWRR